jgi:pimeloyl-ACP methyl ester carboxylesterase
MTNGIAPVDLGGPPFEHRMVAVAGLRFHCVLGGSGPTIVLLAGFPQSWYAWRRVMPLLAPHFRVIALDLPGQGDSDKPMNGYDTQTTARRVNGLLKVLGVERHLLVGHDIGSWIGYPYAHEFEQELGGIVFLDGNIPGITLQPTFELTQSDYWRKWHFLFNMIEDLPEALLVGRERVLIEWFFNRKTAVAMSTFSRADIDEYERVYSLPGGMRGMLGYYRAVIQDMEQNQALQTRKLKLPILALGGDGGSAPNIHSAMLPLGEDVRGGVIPNSGHYIPEEQPEALAAELVAFAKTLTL